MSAALPIRGDLTPKALRRQARHEANRRAALRMLAIANALDLIQLFARVVVWSIAFLLILNNLGFDVTALVAGQPG